MEAMDPEESGESDPIKVEDDQDGSKLASTATSIFNLILVGLIITLVESALYIFRKRNIA